MNWDRTALVKRYGSPARRVVVTLTETTADSARQMASDDGVSVSELMRDLIADESARRSARHAKEAMWTK